MSSGVMNRYAHKVFLAWRNSADTVTAVQPCNIVTWRLPMR